MKTGRVRKKEGATPEPTGDAPAKKQSKAPSAKPKSTRPRPKPAGVTPPKPKPPYLVLGILGAILACLVIFVAIMTMRGGAKEWVKATRADGAWTTTVVVLGPQVTVEERWETECINDSNSAVRAGTCILKDAETYQDKVVDDYEEYAYNIYYEESWDKVYQAQGTEFVVTALGGDDWWEGNLHYTRQEELDKGTCEYTNYTVWVDDPQNSTQEAEVYLAECEVWDHVVVEERVYDQQRWCQCDVTTVVEIGQQSEQGTGINLRWPNPAVPAGGRTERSFKGQVTFLGDDYSYTTTTEDLATYQDYMTSQYYIGLNDGRAVTIRKNPPD
jgi:hypothetical protein